MSSKTKLNILAIIFALLIFLSLFFAMNMIWGAALGTAFFAFIIWNNKLRKAKPSEPNDIEQNDSEPKD